jgi:hypothetical protein
MQTPASPSAARSSRSIRAKPGAKLTTSKTRLYTNGAWTNQVFDAGGKLEHEDSGCLKTELIETIRTELSEATWKTTRRAIACRVDQPRFTTYTWKGRQVFTERTCNVEVLDKRSRRAIDVAEMILHPRTLGEGMPACSNNPLAKGCL